MASSSSVSTWPRQLLMSILLALLFLQQVSSATSSTAAISNNTSTSSSPLEAHLAPVNTLCQSTPYPDACFDSLKLSIGITVGPTILPYFLQSLQFAISEASKLSSLLFSTGAGIVEERRGALQDCREVHAITLNSLSKSVSLTESIGAITAGQKKLSDVRAHLSAALTNRETCLEGLDSAAGPLKVPLIQSIIGVYKYVSNCLFILSKSIGTHRNNNHNHNRRRRLLSSSVVFPAWLSRRDRRLLQEGGDDDGGYDPSSILTVAADGSGNFSTVGEAVAFAPNNSADRTLILVRQGVYVENVDIPSYKTNIVLLGDGRDVTIIRGRRSFGDGWTTFRSATVAVSGEGFLARDITFDNAAGAGKYQAVALRVNADLTALYRCTITGYQDTLYVHSFRQFYRECDIYGTVDFIFGNAAVVFQGCNLFARLPIPGQFNVVTAQGRDDPNEDTGISIQNCTVLASAELAAGPGSTKTYLGRPWKNYSRTVYMQSYMDGLVDPKGWTEWVGDQGLDTLYYGEYVNNGPGSATDGRVTWPGYHVMEYDDAVAFTVSEFIAGDAWLDSTSFPYDNGV